MGSINPDVVVVGGGPIGLWTAIQVKASTNKNVLVLEKYKEYKRADINLRIAAASLKGLPNIESLKPLKLLASKWGNKSVPIKQLEEELEKCAHDLGIKILKGAVAEPKTLHQQYPSAKVFIGADGARSSVRKELFGDQFRFNNPLQYIVQAQYKIQTPLELDHGSYQKAKQITKTYIQQKFAGNLITQIIRPLANNESQVTLRIFVDESTYKKMANATFSNPYYFEKDLIKIPDELRETLIKWWGSQSDHKILAEAEKTNKITVIPLASYASKEAFIVTKNERRPPVVTALVGDALQAFPFFRAINNGFLNGTKLAECVKNAFKELETAKEGAEDKAYRGFTASFNSYSRYTAVRAFIERWRALFKNMFIVLSNFWFKHVSSSPLEVVKWTQDEKKKFYEQGSKIWAQLTKSAPPQLLPLSP